MIIINEQAVLIIEDVNVDNIPCTHAYISYYDGDQVDIGYIKKGEGNFLFSDRYVFKWPLNKGNPTLTYDVLERHEIVDKEQSRLILGRYKKYK